MPIISPQVWITKEGQQIEIAKMASSHLLSTIHFIERNRFNNVLEVYDNANKLGQDVMDMANYYAKWPIQYEVLVKEAQRRNLIARCEPVNTSKAIERK